MKDIRVTGEERKDHRGLSALNDSDDEEKPLNKVADGELDM